MPFPDIDPIAFSLGPFVVRWYALAYITGFLGGWWLARRIAAAPALWGKTPRPDKEQIDDLIVWVALGVIIGGRLGYVLFLRFRLLSRAPARDSLRLAGRHVLSWRASGCAFRLLPVCPVTRPDRALHARSRRCRGADRSVLRTHRQFHQWRALGSPGAGFPLRGDLPPMGAPCPATRPSSSRPRRRGSRSSS